MGVLNYQGGDLGCSVSSTRTSELSSIQGDLAESGNGIKKCTNIPYKIGKE